MKGKAPVPRTSVTSATAAKASKQHAVAVAEPDHLIGGDRKASMTDQETDTVEFASMFAKGPISNYGRTTHSRATEFNCH